MFIKKIPLKTIYGKRNIYFLKKNKSKRAIIYIPGINKSAKDDKGFSLDFAKNIQKYNKDANVFTFDFFSTTHDMDQNSIERHLPKAQIEITKNAINYINSKFNFERIELISLSYGAVSHLEYLNNTFYKVNKNIFLSPVFFSLLEKPWFLNRYNNIFKNNSFIKDFSEINNIINKDVKNSITIINGTSDVKDFLSDGEDFYKINKDKNISRKIIKGDHTFNNVLTHSKNIKNKKIWNEMMLTMKAVLND